ncbi:ATP-binding protein [Rhodoferax sp. GW822-FHT02A01]|uniref:PAS domain-containing sensor histidine kinase n=1 Tax=Rhodoferax sp. GW822-FHT02A01 TaxID=3141537 RepID=UPI00315D690A
MKKPNISVAFIVIMALVAVITIFLGAFGFINYRMQKLSQYEQLQQELTYSAEQLSSAVALPLWNFDEEQIESLLTSAMKFESVYGITLTLGEAPAKPRYIKIRGNDWEVMNGKAPFDTQGLLEVARTVHTTEKAVGSIRMFATTRFIEERLHIVLVQTLLYIAVIDFLLVISLYYVLWRTILKPLKRIEAYAVLAGIRDELPRMDAGRFHGELESLRSAIVRMTALLASRLTDMREQSEVISAKEQSARLNELRVSQILTASPLPITVGNFHTGVYVRVNPAWERVFQYEEAQILGKTSVDLGFWKDARERQGWLDRFNVDGRVSGYEVTFRMRDGSSKIFMLSSERFLYGDEECVLTMSIDVTERKAMESELMQLNAYLEQRVVERTRDLNRSNEELLVTMQTLQRTQHELIQADKLASLGSLVAGVAHELNTPIGNALVAASSVSEDVAVIRRAVAAGEMKRSTFDNFLSRVSEGAGLTLRSLQRAVALITSFKQVAVDQASERRRAFDLAQVLGEVIDTLKPNLRHVSVRLELDLQVGIAMQSYPGPLGQVIINLFTNAMAHAFEGRTSGLITVCAHQLDAATVQVLVSDDGVGIPPENLGQIFDPFFTTKLGRGGSGLGLSVSHRIVTKVLGGQIAIRSKPGEGATFELTLPTMAPDVIA